MKKPVKKILKITGVTLLALILFAFAAPFLFKNQIVRILKKEINNNIDAEVDFSNVSISLLRRFPKASVTLNDFYIKGTGAFSKDTLIAARGINASVNLISLFRGSNIKVYAVHLQSPRMHLLVNEEGRANWDIAKTASPESEVSTGSAFKINLQRYSADNGYLLYKDETADINAEIVNFNHSGSGDLMADQFMLATNTSAEKTYFTYAGIPYLAGNRVTIRSDINVSIPNNKYDFNDADIRINNFRLDADGFFQLENDSTYNMDVRFKAPSTEFREILSLVPGLYKNEFEKIKTGGTAVFDGFVKGRYSPRQMPAYNLNLEVTDAFFQYPDLPEPVKNIQLLLKATNPDGQPDNAVIDISKGHIEMGNEPFDFRILFRNPETVQYLDASVKGKINLAEISKFIKLENDIQLSGFVNTDAFARGNLSALEKQGGSFSAGGFFDIKNLFYSAKNFPQPIRNGNIKATLVNSGGIADNTVINISTGHIELGKDPFDFAVKLSNPVSSANFEGMVNGKFTLDNIKQFITPEKGTKISGMLNAALKFKGSQSMITTGRYDQLSINGTAGITGLKYVSKNYPGGISIENSSLALSPASIALKNFSGSYMNTRFTASGMLNNLVGYMMADQPLSGTVNVYADRMNLNDWMGTEPDDTASESGDAGPFLVPAGIHLTINAKADEVKYDKVDYRNVSGTLQLEDETIKLNNIKTDALDGNIIFNGTYSTKANKKEPDIRLSYAISHIDVQKAFFAYNTVQQLMPIGQFIAGRLSSELNMAGHLKENMMPDINSLSGKGNLFLLEGVLNKFKPMEKIAETLQINELRELSVKDIKNYIEFKNGQVLVKPFLVKVKDIEMEIGGMHGIDQSLNYIVQMKVPRRYLGKEGNALVNDLAAKANSKGIPVQPGETVNLHIKVGGTVFNPAVKTELKEAAGDAAKELKEQAVEFARQKADSAKQTVKDSLDNIKKDIIGDVKDELKKQIFSKDSVKTDSASGKPFQDTKKKAGQTIKNTMDKLLNKKKKTEADTTLKNVPG